MANLSPMEAIRPLAAGVTAMAMVYALSAAYNAWGVAATFSGFSNPREELTSLDKRIYYLRKDIGDMRESMVGTRNHKIKLMHDYGFTVQPSIVEMKKYPLLRTTDFYLKTGEDKLDKMEVKMLNMQKRRSTLRVVLGLKPEESPMPTHYQTPKKYPRPLIKDI